MHRTEGCKNNVKSSKLKLVILILVQFVLKYLIFFFTAMLRANQVPHQCQSLSSLPPQVQIFIAAQLKSASVKKMTGGWSSEMIEFSLGLQHQSNSAYRYLQQQQFALPSLTVLQRKRAQVMKEVGPCPILLKLLGDLAATWEPDERYDMICFYYSLIVLKLLQFPLFFVIFSELLFFYLMV